MCLREMPSYRHRGVTIEGAVSCEHVMDMIDWLPKAGMNACFIQFLDVPFVFYDRWYSHLDNESMPPEPLSMDEVSAIKFSTVEQINFLPTIRRNMEDVVLFAAVRQSWKYLLLHADYCGLLAAALIEEIRDKSASHEKFERLYSWCRTHEPEPAPALDVFEMLRTMRRMENEASMVFDTST